jgi:2-dehydropantoate 2-reductase
MKSERRYAIIGTGALGGFYGAKLQKAGLDVHFLINSDYKHVKKFGLVVESKDGDFSLPHVNAYCDVTKMPQCDVVVVALKTTHNYLLPQMLPPIVKDGGVVLVLQNGLGIEEEVAQIVNGSAMLTVKAEGSGSLKQLNIKVSIIGGLCYLCANKVSPGHIHHLDYGQITLAEYIPDYRPAGVTERMRLIINDFESAGIAMESADDLLLARWQKLVWNIPYNGLSVILNAQTDELMANFHTRTLVEQLMYEVATGAKSSGRIIPDSFIQKMLDYTVKMTPYRPSMKIDYDEHRPLEVEAIFGNPLRKAQAAGVELPKISCLYQQLQFLDKRNLKPQK